MDIVHHAFIGGVGYMGLASAQQELAGMAFIAGSVLPDLDVVFMVLGKRVYLKNHQGLTHSLLLAPLFALIIALLPAMAIGLDWVVFSAALAGIWLHSLLDYSNTFGITLFWPLTKKRYCVDAVFFIDSFTWLLTIVAYLLYFYADITSMTEYYFGIGLTYFLLKSWLHRTVKKKLGCTLLIPSALNPFTFFVLFETESGCKTALYNSLTGQLKKEELYTKKDDEIYALAEKSPVYRDMKKLARFFFITEITKSDETTEIKIKDLGIRNFGGRFAETTLLFNSNEELIREVANI